MSPHATYTTGIDRRLWITGLGSQYPPHVLSADKLEELAGRFHNTKSEGIRKVFEVNRKTGIESRAVISDYEHGFGAQQHPPSIVEIDHFFRQAGVALATQACRKALQEAGLREEDITHSVAVTCTSSGNPGYDVLVNRELGLSPRVDRTLLHGVGCAGGLSIMRTAAQIALAATARGRPARVLAYACELCSPNLRCDLAAAEKSSAAEASICSTLFSDSAAAIVLCNSQGLDNSRAIFQLGAFDSAVLPDTVEQMSFCPGPTGFRTVLSRSIPKLTKLAIKPMFECLSQEYSEELAECTMSAGDFDWALHPGGEAIINGVKAEMRLEEEQLRASREIYRTRGNSSSPTVLIVLDRLRTMGHGLDNVVAASFGPGLTIEMAMLRRRDHTNSA